MTVFLLALVYPIQHALAIASPAAVALTALTAFPAIVSPVTWGLAQGLQRFTLVAVIYASGPVARIGLMIVAFSIGLHVGGAMLATFGSMMVALAPSALDPPRVVQPASGSWWTRRPVAAQLDRCFPVMVGLLAITVIDQRRRRRGQGGAHGARSGSLRQRVTHRTRDPLPSGGDHHSAPPAGGRADGQERGFARHPVQERRSHSGLLRSRDRCIYSIAGVDDRSARIRCQLRRRSPAALALRRGDGGLRRPQRASHLPPWPGSVAHVVAAGRRSRRTGSRVPARSTDLPES